MGIRSIWGLPQAASVFAPFGTGCLIFVDAKAGENVASGKEKALWEKQPGESHQAFAAFSVYRDLGSCRKVPIVAQECGKSTNLLYRWSSQWNWQQRAEAYDESIAEEARKQLIQQRADAVEQNLKISKALKGKALKALKELQEEKLSPRDIKDFLRLATDLEHQSLYGVASDNELALRREMFEHRKEKEDNLNIEIEDMREIREAIFGNDCADENP